MRKHLLTRVLAIVAAILLMVSAAPRLVAAQPLDMAGGYSFARITNGDGLNEPVGWFGSIGVGITSMFAIVGEVNGAYKTDSETFADPAFGSVRVEASHQAHSYLAGPRLMSRPGNVRVFGQVLFGGETDHVSATGASGAFSYSSSNTETNYAIQPGGGVDVKLANAVGLRVGGSFRAVHTTGDWGKIVQFYTGVVFSVK
jgi:outer membrane protein with beta-barrel domain